MLMLMWVIKKKVEKDGDIAATGSEEKVDTKKNDVQEESGVSAAKNDIVTGIDDAVSNADSLNVHTKSKKWLWILEIPPKTKIPKMMEWKLK